MSPVDLEILEPEIGHPSVTSRQLSKIPPVLVTTRNFSIEFEEVHLTKLPLHSPNLLYPVQRQLLCSFFDFRRLWI